MIRFSDKLNQVHDRLHRAASAAGRDPGSIRLIAVSKTQPASAIRSLYQLGQRQFGENYLQEALDKQAQLADLADIQWHFIGPIQSNKTRDIASHFAWVHSVDRLKVARRLSDQRDPALPPLNICLQLNPDGEASKSGVAPAQLAALAGEVARLPRLRLRGLMAIPAPRTDYPSQLAGFRAVADALAQLKQQADHDGPGGELDTLSMGMSGDMEAAIAAGATFVRIGTDLFGPRF